MVTWNGTSYASLASTPPSQNPTDFKATSTLSVRDSITANNVLSLNSSAHMVVSSAHEKTDLTVSSELEDVIDNFEQDVRAKVIVDWARSNYMDNILITATDDGVTSVDVPAANNIFKSDQASNGVERGTFRWGVCDAVSPAGDTIRCDTGYRTINVDPPFDGVVLEYGWWAKTKSDGSGVYGDPPTLQVEFDTRKANYIAVHFADFYGPVSVYNLHYKDTNNLWVQVGGEHNHGKVQYEHDLAGTLDIKGVRVTCKETKYNNDVARIQEIIPIYRSTIESDIVSMSLAKIKEEHDTTVPLGITSANTLSLELSNVDKTYSSFENTSDFSDYLRKDVVMTPYLGWKLGDNSVEWVPQGVYYVDDWQQDSESMVTTAQCRDRSKFLQEDGLLNLGFYRRNVYASEYLVDLALLANLPEYAVVIKATGHKFPHLYSKDGTPWDAMLMTATADLGMFWFDEFGSLVYNNMESLYSNPPLATHTLSDDNNIVSGSTTIELQTNKVTVKMKSFDSSNVGVQSIWRADSGESLVVAQAKSDLTPTSSSLTVNNTNSPLWKDSGFFKIDDEIIAYSGKTATQFTGLRRGQFGTTPAAHSTGAKVRETRSYNIEYSNAPAANVQTPLIIAEGFDGKAYVDKFTRGAFSAHAVVSATTKAAVGETVMLEGSHPVSGLNYYFSIQGIPLGGAKSNETEITKTASDPNSIRRYRAKELTIDNPFIMEESYAQKIAEIVLDNFQNPVAILNLGILGRPHLQLEDKVLITSLDQLDISDREYFAIETSITYNGGVEQNVVLKAAGLGQDILLDESGQSLLAEDGQTLTGEASA